MSNTRKENKTYELDEMEFAPESNFEPKNIDPKNAKVRITMWVDGDVILAARAEAKAAKKKYQTLLNERLREAFVSQINGKPTRHLGISSFNGYSSVSIKAINELIDQKISKALSDGSSKKKDSRVRGPVFMRKKSSMKRTKSA